MVSAGPAIFCQGSLLKPRIGTCFFETACMHCWTLKSPPNGIFAQKTTGAIHAPKVGSSRGRSEDKSRNVIDADLALSSKSRVIVCLERWRTDGTMPITLSPYAMPGRNAGSATDLNFAPIFIGRSNFLAFFAIAVIRPLWPPCRLPRPATVLMPNTVNVFVPLTPYFHNRFEIPFEIVAEDAVTCPLVNEIGKPAPSSKALFRPVAALTMTPTTVPTRPIIITLASST